VSPHAKHLDFLAGDGLAGFISLGVQEGLDLETRSRLGRGEIVDGGFITLQRYSLPVLADFAEKFVLDGISLHAPGG